MKTRTRTAKMLALVVLTGIFSTGFTYQQGIGNVYCETQSTLYDQTTFHRQLAGHPANGIQRAYFVQADLRGSDLKPYVFAGEVTGTYTMDTMIGTLENEGYKVVAGINGDLFDVATGTPKGLTIHEGKIMTSGYDPNHVISFNERGEASLEKVQLSYSIRGTLQVPLLSEVAEAPVLETEPVYVTKEYRADIGYFNVPKGAAKALHLFNRHYGSTSKTTASSVEVLLEAESQEAAQLRVGGTLTAQVLEVRSDTFNTPIGDRQLVLSTEADSPRALELSQLVPGSTVEISVTEAEGGRLIHSREALGVYYVLYDQGQYVSKGTNLNPRTIIGIKPDGTLMLYVLDGRQPGFATGMGLSDTARHLVDLGCTTVVNMDGGGSSVISVREAGVDARPVMKNVPSGQSQRRTTNGLLLVYDPNQDPVGMHLHTYPSQPLAMPGAEIVLTSYGTNGRYEPFPLLAGVEYSLDPSSGSVVDHHGVLTVGSTPGTVVIEARSGDLRTTAQVEVWDQITYSANVQELALDPGKSFDLDITAQFGLAPIASKDSLFTWTCDPAIGTIDEKGLFQATQDSGVSGNIEVVYRGQTLTIPVQVGADSLDFSDTKSHWARFAIGRLAAKGMVNGMGDNVYQPDGALTRAQFLAMLAKTVSELDLSQTPSAGFGDVLPGEWYYDIVNWGYKAGIVSGVGDQSFAPNQKITREQMAVMLNNFANHTGLALPVMSQGMAFVDGGQISTWAAEAVQKVVVSGMMSGYPEGNYKPQGSATRAEAASVLWRLVSLPMSSS